MFVIPLLFLTCQKDDVQNETVNEEHSNQGFLVKRLDFNTISQNTNIIDELKRFTNKKNIDNSLSRVVNDSVNGFSIDTEEVLFIEKEGYH